MKKVAKVTNAGKPARPCFTHDCEDCQFLGRLNGEDLYCCKRDGSFVRRYGHLGPEYGSAGEYAPEGSPYALAKILWERRQQAHTEWKMFVPRTYETAGGGAMIRLSVKGDNAAQLHEHMGARGIHEARLVSVRHGCTLWDVPEDLRVEVIRWYCEPAQLGPEGQFPFGTLLFHN